MRLFNSLGQFGNFVSDYGFQTLFFLSIDVIMTSFNYIFFL